MNPENKWFGHIPKREDRQEGSGKEMPGNRLPSRAKNIPPIIETIKQGTAVTGCSVYEKGDTYAAAQAVVIDALHSKLISEFQSPELPGTEEFFNEFLNAYFKEIPRSEKAIFESLANDAYSDENDSSLRAALVTADITGFHDLYENPNPSSKELFAYMPMFARAYKEKLQDKYGSEFDEMQFIESVQNHLPKLLKHMIAQDPVYIDVLTAIFMQEPGDTGLDNHFDVRMFELGNDDRMKIKKKVFEATAKEIGKQGIDRDKLGRTHYRGCPVLYTDVADDLIQFAVDELIKQYKKRYNL